VHYKEPVVAAFPEHFAVADKRDDQTRAYLKRLLETRLRELELARDSSLRGVEDKPLRPAYLWGVSDSGPYVWGVT
jgi:hypothetical protein